MDDGHALSSSQIYEFLSNVMYEKRSKFDPFWNAFLVGGMEKGEPFVPLPYSPSFPHSPHSPHSGSCRTSICSAQPIPHLPSLRDTVTTLPSPFSDEHSRSWVLMVTSTSRRPTRGRLSRTR
jgi:hypothetical protein